MDIAYREDSICIIMLREEAEGVRRKPNERIFIRGKDSGGREYFLINTEHPENYLQLQVPREGNPFYTIKMNDEALEKLLKEGAITRRVGSIELTLGLRSASAENLLNRQN
jgi:hypothetical protein